MLLNGYNICFHPMVAIITENPWQITQTLATHKPIIAWASSYQQQQQQMATTALSTMSAKNSATKVLPAPRMYQFAFRRNSSAVMPSGPSLTSTSWKSNQIRSTNSSSLHQSKSQTFICDWNPCFDAVTAYFPLGRLTKKCPCPWVCTRHVLSVCLSRQIANWSPPSIASPSPLLSWPPTPVNAWTMVAQSAECFGQDW